MSTTVSGGFFVSYEGATTVSTEIPASAVKAALLALGLPDDDRIKSVTWSPSDMSVYVERTGHNERGAKYGYAERYFIAVPE